MATESEQVDQRVEALEHCISRLSEKHQRVLERRYRDQDSRKDIAEAMGLKENSVSVLLRRVRHVLEDCVTRRLGGASS
jgi:RNA polymerase sigma-70 factor (ECF subfamily)